MRLLTLITTVLLLTTSSRGQDKTDATMEDLARTAFTKAAQQPDSGMTMADKALQYSQRTGNKEIGGLA